MIDNENFKIKRFENFELKAGEKMKKILIIETTKKFENFDKTSSNISIEIFAKENEKIKVKKEISFLIPKN